MIAVPSVFCVGGVHWRLTELDCDALLDDEPEELIVDELEADELEEPEDGVVPALPLLPPQPVMIKAKPSAASAALMQA